MKLFKSILICLLVTVEASAQKSQLALDEHNKFIYYQVVEMPGLSLNALEHSAVTFTKAEYPKNKTLKKEDNGTISVSDKFLTYAAIAKHASGEVTYTLNIGSKENKYRYWITGFKFTPYQRDRYGNFVPQNGLAYALEDTSKFDKKALDGYLNQTALFCVALGDKLKAYMTGAPAPKKEEITKKVVTDKW